MRITPAFRVASALGVGLAVIAAGTFLSGCSAASRLQSRYGNKFKYSYQLVSPSFSQRMAYRDKRVAMAFRVDGGAVRFLVQNLTTSDLQLLWKQSSIGIKGKFSPVRNSQTLYLPPATDPMGPVIPPRGYVVDLAIPEEHVYFDGSKWREMELFPTTDGDSPRKAAQIKKNVGSKLDFQLPMLFGKDTVQYSFRFVVSSVDPLPWKDYRRPRRPNPPPYPRTAFDLNSPIVTAATTTLIVGTIIYLATQKKSPPSE